MEHLTELAEELKVKQEMEMKNLMRKINKWKEKLKKYESEKLEKLKKFMDEGKEFDKNSYPDDTYKELLKLRKENKCAFYICEKAHRD